MNEQQIKKRIMRRVHAVWLMRQLKSGAALRVYVLLCAAAGLSYYVSFGKVIANMPQLSDMSALSAFIFSAFLHTEMVAQMFLLVLAGLFAWVLKDIATFKRLDGMLSGARW